MESSADRNKFNIGPGRRPAPPPRPSRPSETQDDLRSSDSDSKSFSTEAPHKPSLPKLKAIIVGGGFAGASLSIALQKLSRLEVTLIDTKDCFLYTPSVFHLISHPERINSIVVAYRDVLKKGSFIQGTVEEVSRQSVRVNGTDLLYDYCFICTGMHYMIPGPSKRQKRTELKTEPSQSSLNTDLRKSPRRKRNGLSSSSKHSTFSSSQRLKAIFKDAIIGPMFSSFVASRPQLWAEYNGLLLLKEIKAFNTAMTGGSGRHSSSSSSSTSSAPRAARKLFTAIIQQFIISGAPQEVRFTSASCSCPTNTSGHVIDKTACSMAHSPPPPPTPKENLIKEQLIAQDPKTIDSLVFKSVRQAMMNLLTEVALPAFLDAAAIPSALPLPIHLSSTSLASSSGVPSPVTPGSPLTSSSPSAQYSPHSIPTESTTSSPRKSHTNSPRSNPDGSNGVIVLSKPSVTSSSTTTAASANTPLGESNSYRSSQAPLSASEGGRRRRSASSGHASSPRLRDRERDRDRDRDKLPTSPRHAPFLSSLNSMPTALASVANAASQESNGSMSCLVAPVAVSASAAVAGSTSSTTATTTTTVRTSRLVMEIHETQYSNDSAPSPSSAFLSGAISSSRTASPPVTESKGSPSLGLLNLRFHALIPALRTLQTTLSTSLKWKDELATIEDAQRIVIVGGDLVAIELAAEIHSNFPKKTITIIHSHRHLIGNMSESVRLIVDNFFKNRQIEVLRKKIVVAIQPFKLPNLPTEIYHLLLDDGTTIEADKVFCCNLDYQHGNTSCLETHFSEFLDGRGFAKIDKYLRFAGTENIFALGDVACLNEYKVAERARAHASLVATNIQRLIHGLELESYRERAVPKTYDLILGPSNGIQIENGRFVRIGPGPVERRGFAERRILHRFGAVHLVLSTEWSQLTGHHSPERQKNAEDETAGSRGDTSSEVSLSKKAKRKLPLRRFSENATEEDSDELKPAK